MTDKLQETAAQVASKVNEHYSKQGTGIYTMFIMLIILLVYAGFNEYTKHHERIAMKKDLALLDHKCDSLGGVLTRHLETSVKDGIKVIEKNNNLLERLEHQLDRGVLASKLDR